MEKDIEHGVKVTEYESVAEPITAGSGVPFFVGIAPIQSAKNPARVNTPILCTKWEEAVAAFGYSEDWDKYSLCEAMYSHFKLYKCQPAIFCNVLDLGENKESVAATGMDIEKHRIVLEKEAICDDTLIVKATGGAGAAYAIDKDYGVYYSDEGLVIEFLEDGQAYEAVSASVAYSKVKLSAITKAEIATGIESIEYSVSRTGINPDLICVPKYSKDPEIAAVMAAKAPNINGVLKATALCDADTAIVKDYTEIAEYKEENGLADKNLIVCWPMCIKNGRKFHMSTHYAGIMARVDSGNEDCPYESPSNKTMEIDGLILEDGSEVDLLLQYVNALNNAGVVTAIKYFNGWTAFGNYMACFPENNDAKDAFIPLLRVRKWLANELVKKYWRNVDDPTNRREIDEVVDSANIWINGLVGKGFLYGGRFEMRDADNPIEELQAGKIKIRVSLASPPPMQQIEFLEEFDLNYIKDALGGGNQ